MTDQEQITFEYFHWGPLICKYSTDVSACDKITKIGRTRKEHDYRAELAGHIDHEFGFTESDREKFLEWFGRFFDSYTEQYKNRFSTNHGGLELKSLWINFMKAGDFNPPHMHTDHISFVLFTSDMSELNKEIEKFKGSGPAPGQIIFNYGENSYTYAPDWNIRNHYQTPKQGDLYIFPALLKHWVAPYKTDIERVSVSGNLKFREMVSNGG